MKTDNLIKMLATGSMPVAPQAALRRFMIAMSLGLALLLMLATLGIRSDLLLSPPMLGGKLVFALTIAITSMVAVFRLGRPGMRLGRTPVVLIAPVVAMWLLALIEVIRTPAEGRLALLLGQTWFLCPFLIAMLSVPIFIAVFWAVRELAPTRSTLTGAFSGLAAGSASAVIYSLHCPEMSALFIGTWYVLGMLIPVVAGMFIGNKCLRW